MNDYREQLAEYERDGWRVVVEVAPDDDYQPGEDDEVYPRLTAVDYGRYYEESDRDEDGRFIRRPIRVDDGRDAYEVTPDEIARIIDISGGNPRRMRAWIESTARAIVRRDLSWVGVVVTASRGEVSGTASIWGVDYDVRDSKHETESRAYVDELAADLAGEAIDAAARELLGPLAVLALSY